MSNSWVGRSRRTRYWLLIILAGFVALSLVYSVTVPLFEGPDEIWHYAFANYLASGGGLPVFDANQPATFLRNGAHPPLYYALIAALIAPIDRGDFPAEYRFNLANPMITPGASGTSPNLLIHTAREDFPYRGTALAAHVARLVSIALGVLTVVGIFAVAQRLLRDERLALMATALVAFIPQFVYGAATINNDALAAVSATWLLFALLRLMDDGRWRWAVLSGLLLGITLLSKIGMIVVLPIPALAVLLAWWHSHVTHHASRFTFYVSRGLLIYLVAALMAGWWYARNFVLYGDPLMWREWQALTGTGRVPPTPIDFLHDMVGFFGLFWADFSLRVDRVVWPIFGLIALVATGGLIRRAVKRQWPALDWAGLLVGLAWLVLLIATAVRYSFSIYDIHGRLLYPALAIIGVVLVLGLSGWPWSKAVLAIGLVIPIGVAVIAPLAIIQPAYARPIVAALPDGASNVSAKFGGLELIGYQLKTNRVKAGESIKLNTYWQATAPTTGERSITIALVGVNGQVLGKGDALLGTDAYPSAVWQPGELVATPVSVSTLANLDATAVAQLRLGLRGAGRSDDLPLETVVVNVDRPCAIMQAADVVFGNLIRLRGYRIDRNPAGVPLSVTLCWEALQSTPVDYSVFVHVYNVNDQRIDVADAQPRHGSYPTSAWASGDQVEDTHVFQNFQGGDHLRIGLYRADNGERLPIANTNETEFEIPVVR